MKSLGKSGGEGEDVEEPGKSVAAGEVRVGSTTRRRERRVEWSREGRGRPCSGNRGPTEVRGQRLGRELGSGRWHGKCPR